MLRARLFWACFILLSIVAPHARAQENLPVRPLAQLLDRVRANDRRSVESFWDSVRARGTPFVERRAGDSMHLRVSFVWRSDSARNVILENGVNGWNYVMNQLQRVTGTDIWHKTIVVPSNIRIGYVFRENDNLVPWYLEPDQGARWRGNRPDPFNARADSSQNVRSLLIGPDAAPETWSIARASVPQGTIEQGSLQSAALKTERRFSVYVPPGGVKPGLPLLIVFDGPVYQRTVRVPVMLDNLIADGRIKPVAAVFVSQINRMVELEPNEAFTQFITSELLPHVRQKYNTSSDPARNVVMGSSHGGLAANALAIARPDLFGGVISQSASLWWRPPNDTAPEYFARLIARAPKKPIRFYLEVGSFEIDRTRGGQPGQVDVSRHFRDVLVAKGYDVTYSEYPGGHEYQSWRITTPAALLHFFR